MTLIFVINHDINESLQVGDDVYYCHHQFWGGFSTVDHENFTGTGIVHIGKCIMVGRLAGSGSISVDVADPDPATQTLLANDINTGDFLMFSKDNKTNMSSILGYYAETTFMNDSPEKAELFAVSTEFSESSK
jgi:hypothetical protein